MKFLSTFKITKGFDSWLKMYKEIEPDLDQLGIKILWAGTNSEETKVFDVTEVKDPSKWDRRLQAPAWVPEGSWWYDPTTIKTTNGKYSIQTKINLIYDKGFQIGNRSSNKNNSFWVRRLKRSLGLVDLPPELHDMHVWDWGWSFKDYVTKNVLKPNLPKT